MCGITGFIDPRGMAADQMAATAQAMAETIVHRGPDDTGTWIDPQLGIAFGHRRLSVIDLSPHGHQPMVSGDGRWVLNYNGEVFNHAEIGTELARRGVTFRGHSDTEVLVESVAAFGVEDALSRLNGMFALSLWDRRNRELLLVRDRMGEKPLYYGWSNGVFLFASETKALKAHPAFQGQVNRDALALYLRHNYVPAPYSIYEGIHKLPPGTVARIDADRLHDVVAPRAYWSLREAAEQGQSRPLTLSPREATDQLEMVLSRAVQRRMVADVPLGAFLSGGIDSSTVVALMQASSPRPVKTFTIGFHEEGFDEAAHAKRVAAHLGTDHTEAYVTAREAMEVIPQLAHLYDEPFGDSSQIPTHLVSALARRHVTVSLSGDGGDELFAGYSRYVFHRALWQRLQMVPRPLRAIVAATLRSVPPHRWDTITRHMDWALPRRLPRDQLGDKIHKAAGVLAMTDAEQLYRSLISHWQDPNAIVIGGREPSTTVTESAGWPKLADATHRMMFLDGVTYLPDDILVKLDRAAMAVSLETRVPLLDHEVVEFAWRLPGDLKIRDGVSKWVLRRVLDRYVPPALTDRPKMGFGIPIGEWLRGPLRGWAEDLLAADTLQSQGYLDVATVRRRWNEHVSGTRDWKYQLWDVLMFQAWTEAHIS